MSQAWSLELPDGALALPVDPPPGAPYTSMTIHRGWFDEKAPFTAVVTTAPRDHEHLSELVRRLTRSGEGEPIDVPGSHGARRIDTTVELDEGEESLTLVVARTGGGELVALSVRTRPTDTVRPAVDALVAGFRVR